MQKYGYVRVSTSGQNPDRQIEAMLSLGIPRDFIIVEIGSGKDFERPKWKMLRGILSDGDTLYLDELNRLGRDYDGVINEWKYLSRTKKVDIVCLKPSFMSTLYFKRMGKMAEMFEDQILSTLSYVAQSERENTLQRQKEGIALAKARGVYRGRARKAVDLAKLDDYCKALSDGKITARYAAAQLGLTYITFYRRYKEWQKGRSS